MFKYETAVAQDKGPSVAGYGLGGVKGLKNLPKYHMSKGAIKVQQNILLNNVMSVS